MPIQQIDLAYRVKYLSILDQEGKVDQALDPALPEELLLKLYRAMVLGRSFDERMLILQRQGKLGTFAPVKGQEAQIGAVAALEPQDWIIPSFRETPVEIWRGKPMESVLLYYSGYSECEPLPEGLNLLPVSVPVGSQMSHAVGIGLGMKYRGQKAVAATFFGDGATSQGDFHEAMNFAAVYRAPVIFICQNNQWAISLPRKRQTNSATLAQKALAYDMEGIQVDGNDVLAVYRAVREAADRGRAGGGPTLIELVTYRLAMHTTADDPKKYRSEEEVVQWQSKDPITRFEKYLTNKGLLGQQDISLIAQDIKAQISQAEQRWEQITQKALDPLDMFENTYAQMPPALLDQRQMLKRELEESL